MFWKRLKFLKGTGYNFLILYCRGSLTTGWAMWCVTFSISTPIQRRSRLRSPTCCTSTVCDSTWSLLWFIQYIEGMWWRFFFITYRHPIKCVWGFRTIVQKEFNRSTSKLCSGCLKLWTKKIDGNRITMWRICKQYVKFRLL